MATSKVNRIIELSAPMFTQGEIVYHSDFGPSLVSGALDGDRIEVTLLSGKRLGCIAHVSKERCHPFKGSVTLTEG